MPKKTEASGPGPPRKRVAVNGYKLPAPIREGEILTDTYKRQWRIGKSIGVGGFGEIYLASSNITQAVPSNAEYVVKIEPHANGPLFVEINFYIRVAKPELIDAWMKEKGLKCLGMPRFIGSGSHEYKKARYRFLVMERFGDDVGKLFVASNKQFNIKTVLTLGIKIMDVLEYIHSKEYIHADIKGSNLLLGKRKGTEDHVYLVDYGLACRYASSDGTHKEYKPDLRKAHDGTIEYTSRDAHIGAHSRRGDLEILAYNMVHWLCGQLPWEDNLTDPEYVHNQKKNFMSNIPGQLKRCFPQSSAPDVIERYLKYVSSLNFEANPDYNFCKKLFRQGLKDAGFKDDGKLTFKSEPAVLLKIPKRKKEKQNSPEAENKGRRPKPLKSRIPSSGAQSNRVTRNTSLIPVLRSRQNLERLYANDPDRPMKNKSAKKARAAGSPKVKPVSPRKEAPSLDSSLSNPTPAMLQMMQRIQELSKVTPPTKKVKTSLASPESSHDILTPAMMEVVKRREERADSLVRSKTSTNTSDSSDEDTRAPARVRALRKRGAGKATMRRSVSNPDLIKRLKTVPEAKGRRTVRGRKVLANAVPTRVSPRLRLRVARHSSDSSE